MPISTKLKEKLVPALLGYSKQEIKLKLAFLGKHYPDAYVHLDVMDGTFVPYTCWADPAEFGKLNGNLFEVHLMTRDPERYIRPWGEAGATCIIFHCEATRHPMAVIKAINKAGLGAGIALNPDTSLDRIALTVPHLALILLMGVVPGKAGQTFIPSVLKKIRDAHKRWPDTPLVVDGGVTSENAQQLLRAGARELVSTSAIFGRTFTKKK